MLMPKQSEIMRLTFIISILVLLIIGATSNVSGQVISRNASGEVVVTYKDGSWRYFMASDSLMLMQEYYAFKESERPKVHEQVEVVDPVKTAKELPQHVDQDEKQEVESIEDVKVVEDAAISEGEGKLLELMERRLTLTERLRRVESGYIDLSDKEIGKVREELAGLNLEIDQLTAIPSDNIEPQTSKKGYRREEFRFNTKEQNVVKSDCKVVREHDEFSNIDIQRVGPEDFFYHTPKEMQDILKGHHYMDVLTSVQMARGIPTLLFDFIFNVNAKKLKDISFDKNALVKIKFVNGEVLILRNLVDENSRYYADLNTRRIVGRYLLDSRALKSLKKYEIDTIRVTWSYGVEDYTIYNVDLIKNQLNCLFDSI